MTGIERLLQEPAAQAIGWALLHFVWQGTVVGMLAAIALAVLRRSDADVRYVVAAIALAVMATLPAVTAVQTYKAATRAETLQSVEATATGPWTPEPLGALATPIADRQASELARPVEPTTFASAMATLRNVEPWIPMLVLGWLSGVAVLTIRLLSGWIRVQHMKSRGATVAARELQAAVARLSKQLHIYRVVRLVESSRVDVPTVIGWLKPVILLPVSALAGLSQTQVEAILAHELAHIRRHDYLVNLLQALLETLLFYHPAVWWLSRRIRAERENCCDDLAVSLCGDPVAYARALADLEELRGVSGQLAMAASGGQLLERVRRLLLPPPAAHDGRGPVWMAGATALLLVFGVGLSVVSHAEPAEQVPVVASVETSVTAQAVPVSPPPPPVPAAPRASASPARPAPPAPPALVPQTPPLAPTARPSVPSRPSEPSHPSEPSAPSAPSVPSVPSSPVAAPAPPSPAAPPAPPSRQGKSSGNHIWSHNGEKIEIKWSGEFEFTDDDTDVKSMTPGSELRISDGGWLRGRSVEFRSDASGKISRRYFVGSTEHPFDSEGKQWLAQKLPQFIRESGLGAKARVARIYNARGAAGVLAEIGLIGSDWAKRVYYTELFNQPLSADARRQGLEQAGRDLKSDYELASLLISQGDRFLSDAGTRKAYFDAARSIESDYEMRRVFDAGLKRGPLENGLLASMLDASRSIDSDYELASLLVHVVKQQPIESARAPFFAALASVASNYERGRVLKALAERSDLSGETVGAMLNATSEMSSDYEVAQFLMRVADKPVDNTLRVPLFRAIDGMRSDYERGRVLKALAGQPKLADEVILAMLKSVKAMSSGHEASQVLLQLAARHPITGASRDAYVDATERLGDYEQGRALSALVKGERAGVKR